MAKPLIFLEDPKKGPLPMEVSCFSRRSLDRLFWNQTYKEKNGVVSDGSIFRTCCAASIGDRRSERPGGFGSGGLGRFMGRSLLLYGELCSTCATGNLLN